MANTALQLTSLDFDTLKASLKQYLKNQTIFNDYDFESSNMNVLLSVLAYNSYLNSFYLNMVASEAFIDTAQMRSSVVSLAKLLNYTPNSSKSSKATVTIDVTSNQTYDTFIIPKGTQFSGSNANTKFTFVTDKVYTQSATSTSFQIDNVDLYEGTCVTDTFVTNSTIENQRFPLSNPNCDTDSIVVTVYENNGSDTFAYTAASSLIDVSDTSQIYFIQAYEDGFEIVFGDDVFGRKPQDGAVISCSYRVTSGPSSDNVTTFTLDQDLGAINGGSVTVDITTVDNSTGGAVAESIESVRYRAPRYFSTQGRAITTDDYKTLILNEFQDIKTIAIYGGETVTGAVQFGSILMAPVTYSGTALSTPRKQDLKDFISTKMTLGLTPEIIDPDFLYVFMNIDVLYNASRTNKTPSILETNIISAINTFNADHLQDFNVAFRQSKFLEKMQQVDQAIVSVQPQIYIQKTQSPELLKATAITFNFDNAIIPGTIQSTPFQSATDGLSYTLTDYNPNNDTFIKGNNGTIIQNTSNTLYLSLFDPTSEAYSPIGTINYETGVITIAQLTINSFLEDAGIVVTCQPREQDVYSKKNDLLEIDLQQTTIQVQADR